MFSLFPELTVKGTDLQRCDEDHHVCVMDKEHCYSLPGVLDTRTRVRFQPATPRLGLKWCPADRLANPPDLNVSLRDSNPISLTEMSLYF